MSESNEGASKAPSKAPTTPKISTAEQKLEKENRELRRKLEEKEMKLKSVDRVEKVQESDETAAVIANLTNRLAEMEKTQKLQQVPTIDGKKSKYRPIENGDILKDNEAVTFSSRSVMKVIPSYLDEYGREIIAPHKMIIFKYAASDIRQDGPEESIINFCTFSTKLKSEVEFLRNHPEYGLTFSENMNEVAKQDPAEYQFRVKASQEVTGMSPESVYSYAQALGIPNFTTKSNKELKALILDSMVKQWKQEAQDQQEELQKRILEQSRKAKL